MAPALMGAAVALAVLFGPKPAIEETVVVLPSADGHVGTVVVEHAGERHVLHQAYATSRSQGGEQAKVTQLSEPEIRQSFGGVLQALPSRPASFLLYFITGTDELTDESKAELQKVLAELKQRPIPDIAVIGHTDTVGDREANDRLSAQRAERVKGFLVDIGIAAGRIQVAGRGERELLVPTDENVDEPKNRRVEISVR
jgi:outer membrane protein OmpA-like peptidoglycan-associated protein